ncbi:MAG: hypothetical protein SF162_16845 [bacterium]|nr:hypothetical protein [bacterium]
MALLLIAVGGLFTALLFLNNLIKALARTEKVGFWDVTLAFMAVLLTLAGLVTAYLPGDLTQDAAQPVPPQVTAVAAGVAVALALTNALVMLAELFRPWRWARSRGLLGVFGGLLIGLSSVTVPFLSVYLTLPPAETAPSDPVGIAQADPQPESTTALDPTAAASATAEAARARFATLFRAVIESVTDEIDLDEAVILTELERGKPLSELVTENGGSVDTVVSEITTVMQDAIRASESRGELGRIQAALAISQMELFVRIAVTSDINTLGRQFGRPTPAPGEPTEPSFTTLLTALPTEAADSAPSSGSDVTPTLTPTPTDTRTPTVTQVSSPTRTPTLTRTPRPTDTPFPTRQGYATRTPTATATLVTPCLASVDFNLRLRSAPEQVSAPDNTITTIDFGTTIELYGRSPDGMWWFTIYNDAQGWVMGDFMTLSAACDRLPTLPE